MMPQNSSAQVAEAERAELERVVAALAKWPRLSQLLRYIGEKFFSGETDELTEYNIATDVLGRSKTVFNAAEDAIARVETHRLRKRLAEFYEHEGRNHRIQVTLPAGTYIPVFIHKSDNSVTGAVSEGHSVLSDSDISLDSGRPFSGITRNWKHLTFAAIVAIAAISAYVYFHAANTSAVREAEVNPASPPGSASPQSGLAPAPIRVLAGYIGPPRTDSAGRVWNADQYFSAGGVWHRGPEFLARTSDPFIFEYSRTGDFSYNIPLQSGLYELHLFFSTPVRPSEALSTFNISMNGSPLLQAFDINADASGENIADERVFRDVSPGKDGLLRLAFSGAIGTGSVNALEILPATPHGQVPLRLIMQTTPLTDHKGQFWRPDNYFMNGRLNLQTRALSGSTDPDLFGGERYGHFTYAIPVDTRDRYTLILHFAELYFGSGVPGSNGGVGSRVFKVMCNGETLLDDFDIFKEVGSLHEISKTFHHLKPTAQGKLNLTFEPISNNATISGIEVLDEK